MKKRDEISTTNGTAAASAAASAESWEIKRRRAAESCQAIIDVMRMGEKKHPYVNWLKAECKRLGITEEEFVEYADKFGF